MSIFNFLCYAAAKQPETSSSENVPNTISLPHDPAEQPETSSSENVPNTISLPHEHPDIEEVINVTNFTYMNAWIKEETLLVLLK